jgi:glycosyltransferase involved in cell wall biosynthesis
MATMRTQVSLDLVGEGDAEPKLREIAASMGIADRVRWHARVDEATLVKLCQEATALVIPTLHDWLPLTAIHALLCRTPVVAFDFGGITDVVQHGRTGILVPPSNTLALARALDSLLARSDRGATLGDAGRMYALATFAPESVARRFAGIYRQALAPPAA